MNLIKQTFIISIILITAYGCFPKPCPICEKGNTAYGWTSGNFFGQWDSFFVIFLINYACLLIVISCIYKSGAIKNYAYVNCEFIIFRINQHNCICISMQIVKKQVAHVLQSHLLALKNYKSTKKYPGKLIYVKASISYIPVFLDRIHYKHEWKHFFPV